MKAAVLGVGRMGEAISYSMKELGFYVVGTDSYEGAASNFRKHIKGEEGAFYLIDQKDADKMMETVLLHEKPDIVISSLPYHQTEEIAYWCIDNEFRYCDLGGRVDVSEQINKYAKKKAVKPVFTDLGLAPGWINILTEHGCRQIHKTPDTVEMMVGGVPGIPSNPPLNYALTWSIDGLINEYVDECEILFDGEIQRASGLSALETVYIDRIQEDMEAFLTSGGASHTIKDMKERGVKNCFYKTLRWPGHFEAVDFLIRKCDLSNECLLEIFKKGCVDQGGDIVLMRSFVQSGSLSWKEEKIIVADGDGRFSAMQKATASPISSVAAQMAEGRYDNHKDQHRDYWIDYPKALSYKDVDICTFNNNLGVLLDA